MKNWVCVSYKKAKFLFYDLGNLDKEKEVFNSNFKKASVHMIQTSKLKQENLHSNISQVKKMEIRKQSYQKLMNF